MSGLLGETWAHLQLQEVLRSRGTAGGLPTLLELLLLLLCPPAQALQSPLSIGAGPVHLLHVTHLCTKKKEKWGLVDVHKREASFTWEYHMVRINRLPHVPCKN